MLFPILYGHLTFASHRCWTIYIKKGVYLAAEAWRREYGKALQHNAKQEEGRAVVQYIRPGVDPYTLAGWRREEGEDGKSSYVGPGGERFADIVAAYEHDVAARGAAAGDSKQQKEMTSFLTKFVPDIGYESRAETKDGYRFVVTASTL